MWLHAYAGHNMVMVAPPSEKIDQMLFCECLFNLFYIIYLFILPSLLYGSMERTEGKKEIKISPDPKTPSLRTSSEGQQLELSLESETCIAKRCF